MERSDLLRYERMQRGWSQARVAELLGTDAGNVSRWERGRFSPSPYFRERLCQLYDKNAQELGLLVEDPNEAGAREEMLHRDSGASTPLIEDVRSTDPADGQRGEAVPNATARVLASLSYVLGWLTGLLVLLFHRSNRFVFFHSLQSVCFFGSIHLIVLLCALTAPLTAHSTILTLLRDMCGPLAVLLGLIAWAVGMVQAARGKYYQLPLVGTWCKRLARSMALE